MLEGKQPRGSSKEQTEGVEQEVPLDQGEASVQVWAARVSLCCRLGLCCCA